MRNIIINISNIITLSFLLIQPLFASKSVHHVEIEKLFLDAKVKGAFVLYDATRGAQFIYNKTRAKKRFVLPLLLKSLILLSAYQRGRLKMLMK